MLRISFWASDDSKLIFTQWTAWPHKRSIKRSFGRSHSHHAQALLDANSSAHSQLKDNNFPLATVIGQELGLRGIGSGLVSDHPEAPSDEEVWTMFERTHSSVCAKDILEPLNDGTK